MVFVLIFLVIYEARTNILVIIKVLDYAFFVPKSKMDTKL